MERTVYIASSSFGKDSCAMLIKMLERSDLYPLDVVLFVNTGYEFEAVYRARDKFIEIFREKGIQYVELDLSEEFRYDMFEREIHYRDGSGTHNGYGYCGGACRWGTRLKLEAINHFYHENYGKNCSVVEYVGYAADETDRTFRSSAQRGTKEYPLIDLGIKEWQALQICYDNGIDFSEIIDGKKIFLYELFDRLSCWCCRNKNLKELSAMYYFLPNYWEQLKEIQHKFPEMPMKGDGKSVDELEQRFNKRGFQLNITAGFLKP